MRERIANRLREARQARGYETAADAARAFGWNVTTYTSHENGTRGIKRDAALRYSKALGLPVHVLLGLSDRESSVTITSTAPVVATAAWGIWRDKTMLERQESPQSVSMPSGTELGRFGVEVADRSVDKSIPTGSIAICRPVTADDVPTLPIGSVIAVRRWQGDLVETTLRRLSVVDLGSATLTPHSTDPKFKDALYVDLVSGGTGVEIFGVVTAIYQDFAP